MGLFGKKEPDFPGLIGVDIGAGGIKMIELIKEQKRAKLNTYGYGLFTKPQEKTLLDDPKRAGKMIQDIMKKSGMKAKRANASLPSHAVFHAIITIPIPKNKKDPLKPLIEAQVQKLLPQPISEMILDSVVIDKDKLPKQEGKGKKEMKGKGQDVSKNAPGEAQERAMVATSDPGHVRVLVSGAPKELVRKYIDVFKVANLELTSLETEAFALIRSLIGKDKSRIMVVDIGYERTNITIVDQGFPFLHRSIQAGGAEITKAISQQMHISIEEAEQVKLDFAIDGIEGDVPPVLSEAMGPILHEIKYALDVYAQQDFHQSESVDKIVITGGSALLPHLNQLISKTLDMNVYLGDPWARVLAPQGIRPILDEIGPRYSVAVGLAMKDLDAV